MDIQAARTNMLTQQIRVNGVLDEVILDVIGKTPREDFVPETYKNLAYADLYLPLGYDQVMLTPTEEGLILQALQINPLDVVLEVGTGSGYLTALLAQLAHYVYSIEIFADFCANAQMSLAKVGIENVNVINDDAAKGWNEQMPYDVIVITGSLPFLPDDFRWSLKPGGRLFAIVGEKPAMEAMLLTYTLHGEWKYEKLFETVVPRLLNAIEPSRFLF